MSRGRVVVGCLGLDQHEVGAMAVSRLLMRNGFEVIYLGRFNTPAALASAAEQEGARVVGVSVHSWELTAYVDDLVRECHSAGAAVAVGGSVLTEADRGDLSRRGVDAVFGPYAAEAEIVAAIERLVQEGPGEDGTAAPEPLAGRVVAVTGAGRGLGRAYAQLLARQGAGVVVNDLEAEPAHQVADPIGAHPLVADASTAEGARAIVKAALDRYGRLDAVVSNAGILRSGLLVRIAPEDVDAVLAVHVRGTMLLAQAAAQHWRSEAKAGRPVEAAIVTTTSAAGLYGFVGESIYSAAKGAVASFTLVAAAELERYGVTVNAVAPVARTRMTEWLPEDERLSPDHVAPLIGWLVGPDARDVTGRVFEAGHGELALADGWRRAAEAPLNPDIGRLARELLGRAPEPRAILGAS